MTCLGGRPVRRTPLERLHEPFSDPHKFPAQQISLDQIIQRLEEQRPRLVRYARLPAAGALRDLLQAVADQQRAQLLHRLLAVPEEPELFALRQLIFVVVARLGLLHLQKWNSWTSIQQRLESSAPCYIHSPFYWQIYKTKTILFSACNNPYKKSPKQKNSSLFMKHIL